jgi:hypothetical protein
MDLAAGQDRDETCIHMLRMAFLTIPASVAAPRSPMLIKRTWRTLLALATEGLHRADRPEMTYEIRASDLSEPEKVVVGFDLGMWEG